MPDPQDGTPSTPDLDPVERAHLERAARLARHGWGRVHPNPMVGCVLVKDGAVVGEGWHGEFGGPHAEVVALENAGAEADGAAAYVSLEPCRHEGKTPACTDALLRAGIRRVVFGAADPGERSGGGGAVLARAGLEVVGPAWDPERSRRENPAFFHTAWSGKPFVALKLAVSLDGAIAARPGTRTDLTGSEARREVHRLRAGFDAVMVGAGTARVDDPRLTVREDVPCRKPPSRVVLDGHASLSPRATLFRDVEEAPVVVFVRRDAPEDALERLEAAGASVHPVAPGDSGEGLDLEAVLQVCWDTGLRSVLCEGGGRLAASLVRRWRVDRLYLFVAPKLLGEDAVRAFPGRFPGSGPRWTPADPPRAFGGDVLITWDRSEGGS